MQKIKHFISGVFFLLGERLALLIVFFVTGIILLLQHPVEAFSHTDIPSDSFLTQNDQSVYFAPTVVMPTTTPTPTSTPTPTPSPTFTPTPTSNPSSDAIWDQIARCESNQHWNDDTGNGYFGGLQFNQGAWNSVGGSGNPANASREEQIMRAKLLQARRGWGPWGDCARRLGLD